MNNTNHEWKNFHTKDFGVHGIGGENHQIKPSMLI
jgi:hypothetical protein